MNSFVGTAEKNMLRKLLASDDGEIVCSRPGGWWIDNGKVSGKVAMSLLKLCLIRPAYGEPSDSYVAYVASPEVERVLADDTYEPMITRALRTGEPQFG